MRREVVVLAVVGLGLSVWSCVKEEPVPPPCPQGQACRDVRHPCPGDQVCMAPPDEEVDGCANPEWGAALVKVRIKLKKEPGTDRCLATVKPKHVCVMPGGAIRWKVQNHCGVQGNPKGALKITGVTWLECDPKLTALEVTPEDPAQPDPRSHKNQLFCGVPDDTTAKEYEYAVEGPEFEYDDPWIEVRRGG